MDVALSVSSPCLLPALPLDKKTPGRIYGRLLRGLVSALRIEFLSLHTGLAMEVILIRHTSVDVPPGTCYGQTDVALCPTFPEEAAQVARALQSEGVLEAVYTSPLNRCTRLATYCGYADAVCDDRLLEINFGDWEMQRYDEITDPRLHIWYKDYLHVAATGGESFMEQLHRVSLFMKDLCGKPFQKAGIFTHGGVIACAQIYAGITTPEEAFRHIPAYGGIVRLRL